MFGEQPIIGESIQKIDQRGNVRLPNFTHAEQGDKIALMYDIKKTKIIIFQLQEYKKKLREASDKIDELFHSRKITSSERLRLGRYIFGELCLDQEYTVTKNRNILIPSRAIKELNLQDEIFVIGNETKLEIYPDKAAYTLSLIRQHNV